MPSRSSRISEVKQKVSNVALTVVWLSILTTCLLAENSTGNDSLTLILSAPDDTYYSLAREIAEVENLAICHSLHEIAHKPPVFLLWVASPESLSESGMIYFNKRVNELMISSGIITGKTIDVARNLWLDAKNRCGDFCVLVNGGTPPATKIRTGVLQYWEGKATFLPLTQRNMLDNLSRADYFIYNGHSGPRSWVENTHANDIPRLKPCVIFSYGCDNMKLWKDNTIALACIEQGAAAYAGYLYASFAGNIIGQYEGFNCQYTWDEFPIGHVAQIHNRELSKMHVRVPYFFLIGDPRISFHEKPPYELISDEESSDGRTLTFAKAALGFIPVRIPHGAGFNFVSVAGVTATGFNDAYFDSRLQMTNIQNDKYILFRNSSQDFRIDLSKAAGVFWIMKNHALDTFDRHVVTLQHPSFYPLLFVAAAAHFVFLSKRKRLDYKHLLCSAAIGLFWLILMVTYTYFRWNELTVTSKILRLGFSSAVSYGGSFIFVIYGGLLFFGYDSRSGKALALFVAVVHEFWQTIIWMVAPILHNALIGFNVFKMPVINEILIFKMILFGSIFYFVKKIFIDSTTVRFESATSGM